MGDPGVMEDLGGTDDWDLKGEGNANAVFGYVGPHPPLVRTDQKQGG